MTNARLFLTGAAVATALFVSSCTSCPFAGSATGKVNHVVLVWLKRPGNAEDRAKLIEAAKMLDREIAEVESLQVGPVLPSKRPIVDSTYDVGFVMRFADAAAMNRYEKNPIHEKAAKELLLPMAKKVQVYDFVSE